MKESKNKQKGLIGAKLYQHRFDQHVNRAFACQKLTPTFTANQLKWMLMATDQIYAPIELDRQAYYASQMKLLSAWVLKQTWENDFSLSQISEVCDSSTTRLRNVITYYEQWFVERQEREKRGAKLTPPPWQ